MSFLKTNYNKYLNPQSLSLLYLIIIGELIFALPFHISRFFRPSFIEDYNYNNMSLGIAFSVYGITALISYFPGGLIADRLPAKYLLSISLFLTSLGGVFILFNPPIIWLYAIYGYWGITTIFFFWGALIKATRNIAGERQGFSFGMLEGGRGLVASLCASLALLIYSNNALLQIFSKILDKNISPLSMVIFFYTLITFLSSVIIVFFFKGSDTKRIKIYKNIYKKIFLNIKPILCISIIVFAAYAGYKGIDYYSLYFYDIVGYSKEKASLMITNLSYLRPISAIIAGYLADKVNSRRCTTVLFIFLLVSYLCLGFFDYANNLILIIYLNFIISLISIFSLRGIFYSLLKETKIPYSITGISVGIISLIGYFPDILIGPVFGYLLGNGSNLSDYQNCFIFLFMISSFGLISSLVLPKKVLK